MNKARIVYGVALLIASYLLYAFPTLSCLGSCSYGAKAVEQIDTGITIIFVLIAAYLLISGLLPTRRGGRK